VSSVPTNNIRAEGKIKNVNTIEEFKKMDKTAMLETAAKQVGFLLRVGDKTHAFRFGTRLMMGQYTPSLRFSLRSPFSHLQI
jgi:hypothetical protein